MNNEALLRNLTDEELLRIEPSTPLEGCLQVRLAAKGAGEQNPWGTFAEDDASLLEPLHGRNQPK